MTYTSGLRLRVPEPLPECEDGETPQQYFARILAQTAIESATSAENTTGDSAPTPFNLGQVQLDVSNLQTDVDALQDDMTSAQATIAQHTTQIAALELEESSIVSGVIDVPAGLTTISQVLPSAGVWDVVAISGPLYHFNSLKVLETLASSFTMGWTSNSTAGATLIYIAHKRL